METSYILNPFFFNLNRNNNNVLEVSLLLYFAESWIKTNLFVTYNIFRLTVCSIDTPIRSNGINIKWHMKIWNRIPFRTATFACRLSAFWYSLLSTFYYKQIECTFAKKLALYSPCTIGKLMHLDVGKRIMWSSRFIKRIWFHWIGNDMNTLVIELQLCCSDLKSWFIFRIILLW